MDSNGWYGDLNVVLMVILAVIVRQKVTWKSLCRRFLTPTTASVRFY